jgi:hypothetical protein
MRGRCHVHIGLHKTGSTSIQKMLAAEASRLGAHGFYAPQTGLNEAGIAHHLLAEEVNRQVSAGSPQFAALANEMEAKGWPENVVLSSEAFCSRIHKPRVVARLREEIDRLGYDLAVTAYVRPQETAIHSFYTQKIKMWAVRSDFAGFWPRIVDNITWDYERRFAALFDAGIDLRIFPYSPSLVAQGLCRHFLAAVGLPEEALEGFAEPPRVNVTPGPTAIAATRAIDQALENRGIRGGRRHLETAAYLVRQIPRLIGSDEGRFNALSPDIAESIRARFRESNERFAAKAFGRKWDDVFGAEGERTLNLFDPAVAPPAERQAFEGFVSEMVEAICEMASEPQRRHRR